MKVLFLSELFYPHGGGAEYATYLYARSLRKAGFEIAVVTNRFEGESEFFVDDKLKVYRLRLFGKARLNKYLVLRRFDILFSIFIRGMIEWADVVYIPRFWYTAIPLAKLFGKPVVVHLHDYIAICPLSNYYDMSKDAICSKTNGICSLKCICTTERTVGRSLSETLYSLASNSTFGILLGRLAQLSDAVICVSDAQRKILLRADARLRSKAYRIYNPILDFGEIPIEGKAFGYFGGPNCLKGFNVLYQALRLANSNGRKIEVHATGFSDSSRSDFLQRIGLHTYRRLDGVEYKKLYKCIRCVVVPSISPETFSYVVLEALLAGRVVIASEIGAIPEVTRDCDGVILFPSGDYKQLAEKMLYVRQLDDRTVVELGRENRAKTLEKFNNDKSLNDFAALLCQVSEKTRAQHSFFTGLSRNDPQKFALKNG